MDVVAEGAKTAVVPVSGEQVWSDEVNLWCASCCVVDAKVLPHLDGWVECCYEEFWSLWCPNRVASLWDGVYFFPSWHSSSMMVLAMRSWKSLLWSSPTGW